MYIYIYIKCTYISIIYHIVIYIKGRSCVVSVLFCEVVPDLHCSLIYGYNCASLVPIQFFYCLSTGPGPENPIVVLF